MEKTYEWFTDVASTIDCDPIDNGSIVLLDRQRFFSEADITSKWTDQNYTCAITGDPLKRKDAQGAHIKARSLGGTTTYDNLAVVHRDHNRAMGTMDAEEYREMWRNKQSMLAA
jgi:5-methylcytosine-specific restriction endonuclease McrA